jgi:hypothetical protein
LKKAEVESTEELLLQKKTTKKLKHKFRSEMRKEDCFYLGKIAKNLVLKGKSLPI